MKRKAFHDLILLLFFVQFIHLLIKLRLISVDTLTVLMSFSLAIQPDYLIYNVAVRGLSVLCTMSLLPFQPKHPFTYTCVERSKLMCLAQEHNMRIRQGLNSQIWDHEFGALLLIWDLSKLIKET